MAHCYLGSLSIVSSSSFVVVLEVVSKSGLLWDFSHVEDSPHLGLRVLFCSPPPKSLKITFLKNFRLIKSKTFFHNRKLTFIRVVFRLNKTLFTHFYYVRIKCLLMTQSRKLLISSSKMRNYIGKKCEQSLYLNPKLSP